jgi:hypothetical protein
MAVNAEQLDAAQGIFALADRLKALREEKAALEERLKDTNAAIEQVEQELVNAMIAEEMQNFVRGGQMFYLTTKIYTSAVPERKQDLFAWLKANGYGDMVQETVHSQTLAAFIREQLEEAEELPPDLQPLVNVFEKTTVGLRKAPANKSRR